eukprot:533992-Amphidinium_carterae.1
MALRLKGPKNDPILHPWYLLVPSKGGYDWSGDGILEQDYPKEAMHLGIAMVQSPTYQRLDYLLTTGTMLSLTFGDFTRHSALDLPFKLPAFGEMMAVWHWRSKEPIHSMSPRGQVGRMLTCDMIGTKECKGGRSCESTLSTLDIHSRPHGSAGLDEYCNLNGVTVYVAAFAAELMDPLEPLPSADISIQDEIVVGIPEHLYICCLAVTAWEGSPKMHCWLQLPMSANSSAGCASSIMKPPTPFNPPSPE